MTSPNKGRTSAMSSSATDAESIAAPCSLLGPLLRKVSTAASDSKREQPSALQAAPVGKQELVGPIKLRRLSQVLTSFRSK